MHLDLRRGGQLDGPVGRAPRLELREALPIAHELLERSLLRSALGPGARLLRHGRRLLVEPAGGHPC